MLYIIKRKGPLGFTYKTLDKKDIVYVGPVLTETQIDSLKTYGNTVISKTLYESIETPKLLGAIRELVGFNCTVDIHIHENGDSVIIRKEVKLCQDE